MKSILFIAIFLLVSIQLAYCQSVSVGFGPTYIVDKSEVKLHPKVVGDGVGGNDDWVLQFTYSHILKEKYLVEFSFSKYPDATLFYFKNDNGDLGDFGWWGATNLRRVDLGFGYNIFESHKWILIPSGHIGVLFSKPLGIGLDGYIPKESLPSNFKQLEPVSGVSYKTAQIVPSIGIKLGYTFWNRLEFFLNIRQVWGLKKTQQLTLKYSYEGEIQPDAINYTDGTGRFYVIGIGYRFGKKWKSRS